MSTTIFTDPRNLPEPAHCPFCGGSAVLFINTWRAASQEPQDADNVAELDEYQCQGACEGRSFWV